MTLAAVHLAPVLTVPPALLAVAALVWYWRRLGHPAVPSSRRSIRRMVTTLMVLTLPLLVLGLSVHDPEVNDRGYILTWTAIMGMVLLIMLGAMLDVINNLRLYQQQLKDEIAVNLRRITEAEQRQRRAGGEPATENGLS